MITSADIDTLRHVFFMGMALLAVVMVKLPHIDTSCECNGAGCELCLLADD